MAFHVERIGPRTWKIVQGDRFGEYPFAYAIMGRDKCVVIDTCTAAADLPLARFLDATVNTRQLPYLVLLTHIHFDHVGGAGSFAALGDGRLLGTAMCGADRRFSDNIELNSLAAAVGMPLEPFRVTHWAKEGDRFHLGPGEAAGGQLGEVLEVLHTPGHTPDCMCILDYGERRVYCGDMIYPFTGIGVGALGSNVGDYAHSLRKIREACRRVDAAVAAGKAAKPEAVDISAAPAAAAPAAAAPAAPGGVGGVGGDPAVLQFLELIGVDGGSAEQVAALRFSPAALLRISNGSLEEAVAIYFSQQGSLAALAPPDAGAGAAAGGGGATREGREAAQAAAPPVPDAARLSCGHVETSLPSAQVDEAIATFEAILGGALPPSKLVDEVTAEYSTASFAFVLPHPIPKQEPKFPPAGGGGSGPGGV